MQIDLSLESINLVARSLIHNRDSNQEYAEINKHNYPEEAGLQRTEARQCTKLLGRLNRLIKKHEN